MSERKSLEMLVDNEDWTTRHSLKCFFDGF